MRLAKGLFVGYLVFIAAVLIAAVWIGLAGR